MTARSLRAELDRIRGGIPHPGAFPCLVAVNNDWDSAVAALSDDQRCYLAEHGDRVLRVSVTKYTAGYEPPAKSTRTGDDGPSSKHSVWPGLVKSGPERYTQDRERRRT